MGDGNRFDALARALGSPSSRRHAIAGVIGILVGARASDGLAQPEWVDVCHHDASTDRWQRLSVPTRALNAHLKHGDRQLAADEACGAEECDALRGSPAEYGGPGSCMTEQGVECCDDCVLTAHNAGEGVPYYCACLPDGEFCGGDTAGPCCSGAGSCSPPWDGASLTCGGCSLGSCHVDEECCGDMTCVGADTSGNGFGTCQNS
jgi:hypothetical protein